MPNRTKKSILIILSEHGFWGEKLVCPLEVFDKAGYTVTFATPNGRRPVALPASMDANYIDPAIGRSMTSMEMAEKVKKIDKSPRLDNSLNISGIMPEMPYFSSTGLLRDLEAYHKAKEKTKIDILSKFDAVLIVGGSGAIVDLANNQRVHDIILAFVQMDKPVGAQCRSVACLAFAREVETRRSVIWGKHVTGPCREYDHHDGTRFAGIDFNMGSPPYPLEYILRDATGSSGAYIGNFGKETSVIVDYPFLTACSTEDGRNARKRAAPLRMVIYPPGIKRSVIGPFPAAVEGDR
jgi:putative intracellular protease/amidase